MPNQKFLDLLEKRRQAEQVKPIILKPKEKLLTTDINTPILLQSSQLKREYPSYKVFSCLEKDNKRYWVLNLEDSKK